MSDQVINYVKASKKPKKKHDIKSLNLIMELLLTGYGMMDIIGELEEYDIFHHKLKQKIRVTEREIERQLDNYICRLFDINSDDVLAKAEHRRSITREVLAMNRDEVTIINEVLAVMASNNREVVMKRLKGFLRTLKK